MTIQNSPMCTPELAERFSQTAHDLSVIDKQSKHVELTLAVLALLAGLFVTWYAGVSVSDVQLVFSRVPVWFYIYSLICLIFFPIGFYCASLAHDTLDSLTVQATVCDESIQSYPDAVLVSLA